MAAAASALVAMGRRWPAWRICPEQEEGLFRGSVEAICGIISLKGLMMES